MQAQAHGEVHADVHTEAHAASDAHHSDSASAEAASQTVGSAAAETASPALSSGAAAPEETRSPAAHAASGDASPAASAGAAEFPAAQAEIEDCIERIWEQLIEAPPSRGRSMSTVMLKNSKVLLSSWEVTAFLSEGGQDSEDLRRAVVARSLLVMGIDERKHSGGFGALESAIAGARKEVSYFQGRVEQSKRDKNVEAAVNLSISTKRLLSSLEEAEALRP